MKRNQYIIFLYIVILITTAACQSIPVTYNNLAFDIELVQNNFLLKTEKTGAFNLRNEPFIIRSDSGIVSEIFLHVALTEDENTFNFQLPAPREDIKFFGDGYEKYGSDFLVTNINDRTKDTVFLAYVLDNNNDDGMVNSNDITIIKINILK